MLRYCFYIRVGNDAGGSGSIRFACIARSYFCMKYSSMAAQGYQAVVNSMLVKKGFAARAANLLLLEFLAYSLGAATCVA